ncbi:MAG: hypothetical protein LBS91_00320 [Clostridiales Family XIII bacterium]|nr:hypothetical protein [Clostridiales Family XIII bacterium]
MNKTKKLAACIVLVLSIVLFAATGCSSKTAISADDFSAAANEAGYSVSDITGQYVEDAGSASIKIIGFDEGGIHVEFFEMDTAERANEVYASSVDTIKAQKSGSEVSSEVNGKYSKYSSTFDGIYHIAELVGTTVVYANCDKADAETLDGLMESIGY